MVPVDEAGRSDPADGAVERSAPAKLNLYLHVVGRRADGYHDLDSLVAFASIGDRIRVAPATGLRFAVEGRFAADVPSGSAAEENLVVKAARRLSEALNRPPDVAIRLEKSLPPASGIGGGSSDAAATLRALAALWGAERAGPLLHDVACRLGADVPVCLVGGTCRMRGVGDRIDPAPSLAGLPVVLANPLVPVSTPDVFRSFAGPFSNLRASVDPPQDPADLAGWLAGFGNDLQTPAVRLVPSIQDVIAALSGEAGCLLARMSGSGATCFGLFDSADSANGSAVRLKRSHPDWWVESGSLL